MKQKVFLFTIISVVCAFVIVSVWMFWQTKNRVQLNDVGGATLYFRDGENDAIFELSSADCLQIKELFNGKYLYHDHPSCGFSEQVSVRLGEETFCFAQDGCPFVFIQEKNRYLRLTEKEVIELHRILASYGLSFPCL